jgi:predicted DNA binding CopG/RHH family protein
VINVADERKSIAIRVEPAFHQKLKLFAVSKGMTIQEYVKAIIEKDMKENSNK